MLTVFVSIVATLAFEAPIIAIEKILFKSNADKKPSNSNNNDSNQSETQNYHTRINSNEGVSRL